MEAQVSLGQITSFLMKGYANGFLEENVVALCDAPPHFVVVVPALSLAGAPPVRYSHGRRLQVES